MTRKKLKLAYISNDSMRKATYKKRKKGFMKKAHELSILCDIDVCAIIYSPFNSDPDVWPPNPLSVRRVLAKYNEIPELDQTKKKSNHEGHLRQRLGKALELYNKQRRDNREKEMTLLMYNTLNGRSLPNMNIGDVYGFIQIIDQNLIDINTKLQMLGVDEASSSAKPGGEKRPVEQPLLSKLEDNGHK